MTEPSIPLRDRLRAALPAAIKARDRATAATLRSTLAAIENAEAVDVGAAPAAGAIEASAVGIGAAEAARRELTEVDVAAIVRAEIAEREHAAQVYEGSGHADKAAELRTAAAVLDALVTQRPS